MENGGFPPKSRRDCRSIDALAALASELDDRRNHRHGFCKRQGAANTTRIVEKHSKGTWEPLYHVKTFPLLQGASVGGEHILVSARGYTMRDFRHLSSDSNRYTGEFERCPCAWNSIAAVTSSSVERSSAQVTKPKCKSSLLFGLALVQPEERCTHRLDRTGRADAHH